MKILILGLCVVVAIFFYSFFFESKSVDFVIKKSPHNAQRTFLTVESFNNNNSIKFNKSKNITIIEDYKKGLGPLGGVLSAMKWNKINKKNYQWIATFPVDTPFFKKEILKDFIQKINLDESDLFFIKSNDKRHNIFGLWSVTLLEKLEKDLDKGERKVELWANNIGVKIINMKFSNRDPFFNINTKEDLEKARELLKND